MGQTILHNEMQTCSHIEGKDKLLQPKIVNLWKYDGRKTSLVDGNGLKKGDHYMKQDCKHAKKDKTQVGRMGNNVLDQLHYHAILDNKRKWVQFIIVLHLMDEEKPLSNYEALKNFF